MVRIRSLNTRAHEEGTHVAVSKKGSFFLKKKVGIQNYSIWTSRVLPDRTTIQTRTCLTSQIGRDAVFSRLYGRRCPFRGAYLHKSWF